MIPLCRAASSRKAELGVRPRDNQATRPYDRSRVVSFRLGEISGSESGQLPGSPASVHPPNNGQRITANRGAATISAFRRLPRRSSTKAGFSRSPTSDLRPLTSGFTLIELTVVILIIATLAAFTMTAGSHLLDNSRKVQAKNDITQIVTAVNAYYTEYGKYPMVDGNQGTDTLYGISGVAPGNEDVCNVLRAIATGVNANNVLNPKGR